MSGQLDWERTKGEPTPLTKLHIAVDGIAADIQAGMRKKQLAERWGLHGSVYAFIREIIGAPKPVRRTVDQGVVADVYEYRQWNTLQQTAERFKMSESTVRDYLKRHKETAE